MAEKLPAFVSNTRGTNLKEQWKSLLQTLLVGYTHNYIIYATIKGRSKPLKHKTLLGHKIRISPNVKKKNNYYTGSSTGRCLHLDM